MDNELNMNLTGYAKQETRLRALVMDLQRADETREEACRALTGYGDISEVPRAEWTLTESKLQREVQCREKLGKAAWENTRMAVDKLGVYDKALGRLVFAIGEGSVKPCLTWDEFTRLLKAEVLKAAREEG